MSSLRTHPSRGFTMVEVLTVLVILAVLAAIAMPSLGMVMVGQRLRAAGTDLMSSLLVARSEAIKRNAEVQVAPQSGSDWASGWRVTAVATAEQITQKPALGTGVGVALAPGTIVYERNGRIAGGGTLEVEFADSAHDAGVVSRCLRVDPSGMPKLATGSCS
jgi:type IV fimbrial biogenesis protein FimT